MVQAKKEANILLIGDGAVGKTSLSNVYNGKTFSDQHLATLGLDYFALDVNPKSSPNDQYNLKIWDTAGQERFKSLTMAFYKQSHGMMICFDITKRKTFESVRRWFLAVNNNCEADTAVILIGTKCDLADERVVSTEEAQQLAAESGMTYFETSARENINVNEAFSELIDLVYKAKFAQESAEVVQPPARETVKLTRKSEVAATSAKNDPE